ncbi:unnamed protein product, partial [Mesorhabditis belari]|uniref:Uncharacterized protein n=1 Tax=Mesorhabditis belari TaxID=2138241 RepID=A0AAF3J9H9_9BILA
MGKYEFRPDKPSKTVNNHTTEIPAVETFPEPFISLTGNEINVQLIIFSLKPIVNVFFYLNDSKNNVNNIRIQRQYQVEDKLLATGSLLKNIWSQTDPQPPILSIDRAECYVLKINFTQNPSSFYNSTNQVQNDEIKCVTKVLVNDAFVAAFVNESKDTRTELVTQGEMAPNLPVENVVKIFEESNRDFKYSLPDFVPAKWLGETVTFERNFDMSICVWDIVPLKNENFTISLSRLPFNTPVDKNLSFVFEFPLDQGQYGKIHFYEKSNGCETPFDVVFMEGLREKKSACFRLRYVAKTNVWSWDIGKHSTIAYTMQIKPKPYHISFRGKFDGNAMTKVALKYTANKVTAASPNEPIFTKPDPLDEVYRKEFDDFTKNANITV